MDRTYAEKYQELLTRVEKPARYVAGEQGAPRDPRPLPDQVRVALVFPDTYEIGMSHLGLRVLRHVLEQRDGVFVDIVFSPWTDMEREMRAASVPLLGHFSRIPVREFDLVGFSLQSELTYTTVLNLIDLAGLPLHAAERGPDGPVVMAGGPSAWNPEPLADFIDLFFIGDGEEGLPQLADLARSLGPVRQGRRNDFLEAAVSVTGVYVPAVPSPDGVRRRLLTTLSPTHIPDRPLVPLTGISQDRLTLEIMRGCSRGCRFCGAGYIYRPVRERDPDQLVEAAQRGIEASGWEEVGLVSLSSSDHSRIEELISTLNSRMACRRVSVSLPSLRADKFSPRLARLVKAVRKSGFTFAPEAGTERLRRVINKNLSREQLLETVATVYAEGWQLVKLYFMIGLPGEREEDLEGIIDLAQEVSRLGRRGKGRPGRANISLSPFVPKPHTPFQWAAFGPVDQLNRHLSRLRERLSRIPGISVKWHEPDLALIEAVLARGGRNTGRALELAWRKGLKLESWSENCSPAVWAEAFAEAGIDPQRETAERDPEDPLPWDFINTGLRRSFLVKEWQRALAEETTPDCRTEGCTGCGLGKDECDFLRRETEGPGPAVETGGVAAGEAALPAAWKTPEDSQVDPLLYRFTFSKEGPAVLISHLDLVRAFERGVRAAGLRPDYSKGFSPRPRFSYGPPLPLGHCGLAEFFEGRFVEPLDPEVHRRAINQALPEGLRVTAVERLPGRGVSLFGKLVSADYRVAFPPTGEEGLPLRSVDEVTGALERFARRDTWPARSVGKSGKPREVDLIQDVLHLEQLGDGTTDLLFRLRLSTGETAVAGWRLALSEIFGLQPAEVNRLRITRTGFGTRG